MRRLLLLHVLIVQAVLVGLAVAEWGAVTGGEGKRERGDWVRVGRAR